jgi:hypothetical protein
MALALSHYKHFLSGGYAIICLVDQKLLQKGRMKKRCFSCFTCGSFLSKKKDTGVHIQHSQLIHLYDTFSNSLTIQSTHSHTPILSSQAPFLLSRSLPSTLTHLNNPAYTKTISNRKNSSQEQPPIPEPTRALTLFGFPLMQTLPSLPNLQVIPDLETSSQSSTASDSDFIGHYILLTEYSLLPPDLNFSLLLS